MIKNERKKEIIVGIFVIIGVLLTFTSIVTLQGGWDSFWGRNLNLYTEFPNVKGLNKGAIVRYEGIPVGSVRKLTLGEKVGESVRVDFEIELNYVKYIRTDTIAAIASIGVLGDKYIELTAGEDPDSRPIDEGAEIISEKKGGMDQFLTSGDQLMQSLVKSAASLQVILEDFSKKGRSDRFFKNLADSSGSFAKILESDKPGKASMLSELQTTSKNLKEFSTMLTSKQGTLGLLANDPGLYHDLRALLGGAKQSGIVRFFLDQALKQKEDGNKANTSSK